MRRVVFLMMVLVGSAFAAKGVSVVKTEPLKRQNISAYVHVYGKVMAKHTGYVVSPMPGKLIRYTKKQGSFFKKDEPVAYVDRNIPGIKTNPLVIKAPFDGILAITYSHEGDMVAQTKPIALFYSKDLYIEANVGSSLLKKIKNGAPCIIGAKGEKGKGIVESVSFGVDPMRGMGKIKVNVLKNKGLIPGEVVSLSVSTNSMKNVFVVPLEALVERNGSFFVFVNDSGKAKMIPVNVGIISADKAGVSSSILKEGMEIITVGASGLEDGDKVKTQEK